MRDATIGSPPALPQDTRLKARAIVVWCKLTRRREPTPEQRLLATASQRRREGLRSKLAEARHARTETANRAYFEVRTKAGGDGAIARAEFHRVYGIARSQCDKFTRKVALASFRAGAKTDVVVAYATEEYERFFQSFLRGNFGHASHTRSREVEAMCTQIRIMAQQVRHTVVSLRDDYDRNRTTWSERMARRVQDNPVFSVLIALATFFASAAGVASSLKSLLP
jgi:hypothetical protein